MKKLYPFFNFVWKNESQKGHYISMNMIKDEAIKNNYEYLLHMEDDWQFVKKEIMLLNAINILNENEKYGQVLFNINYARN